jgi:hypothetical protein
MKLGTVLQSIRDAETSEKTASTAAVAAEVKTEKVASAPLQTAINDALAAAKTDKTASATPVTDVEKLAAQLETSENEALLKEAQLYGQALADGFVARLTQYDASLAKTASAQPATEDKLAAAAYDQGFEDATQTIYKVASECFALGFAATEQLLAAK